MAAAPRERAQGDQEEKNGASEVDGAFPRHRRGDFTSGDNGGPLISRNVLRSALRASRPAPAIVSAHVQPGEKKLTRIGDARIPPSAQRAAPKFRRQAVG